MAKKKPNEARGARALGEHLRAARQVSRRDRRVQLQARVPRAPAPVLRTGLRAGLGTRLHPRGLAPRLRNDKAKQFQVRAARENRVQS